MSDQNPSNFDPFQPQAPEPSPKKKNSHPVLAAFSVLGVLIILALAAFIYYLLFLAPTRSLVISNQTTQVNVQETALQAAAEATAIEIYLHPSQVPPTQSPEVSEMQGEAADTSIPPTEAAGKTDKGLVDISLTQTVAALLTQSTPGGTTGQPSQAVAAGEVAIDQAGGGVNQAGSVAPDVPGDKGEPEQNGTGLTEKSFTAQVGLLGLLGLATMLLLAIIIVRRLRSSKK